MYVYACELATTKPTQRWGRIKWLEESELGDPAQFPMCAMMDARYYHRRLPEKEEACGCTTLGLTWTPFSQCKLLLFHVPHLSSAVVIAGADDPETDSDTPPGKKPRKGGSSAEDSRLERLESNMANVTQLLERFLSDPQRTAPGTLPPAPPTSKPAPQTSAVVPQVVTEEKPLEDIDMTEDPDA